MEYHAVLTGPFPRSEALVAATRDLDRGRCSAESVEALYGRSEADVSALEARLGLDPVSGGYLAWADLLRPFSESWPGFSVGPVTRWFETNTFYRQPILRAPPERTDGAIAARLPPGARAAPARAKVTLPGPYTFVGLLDNRSGETREALTHRLGRLLAEEVGALRSLGYRSFQFQEPMLVVEPPKGPLAEATVAAYRAIASAAAGARTIVWTYFGDVAPASELLVRLPVGAIGLDLAECDPAALPRALAEREIGLGCLNPTTTLPEAAADIEAIVREVGRRLQPPAIWLGAGAPLDLLPIEAAGRKLERLAEARRRLTAGGPAA